MVQSKDKHRKKIQGPSGSDKDPPHRVMMGCSVVHDWNKKYVLLFLYSITLNHISLFGIRPKANPTPPRPQGLPAETPSAGEDLSSKFIDGRV
jgi:hypothetical protein